MVNAIEQI